jgi:anti-anti-sigma factor
MPLSVRVDRGSPTSGAGIVHVTLDGSLDSTTAPALERELAAALEGDVRALVLDLQRLVFLSSAGVRVIAATRKTLAARGGKVLMINMQPPVAKVFEIIKALPELLAFKDIQELDDYLAAMQRKVREGG